LAPGDEIVVTHLDHDANIAPWLALQERGVTIRYADVDPGDCTLDMASLEAAITPRTRIVALGYASNAVGTINDVRRAVEVAHAAGAWVYVDAVHYAPHRPIDVQALGCDFLVCSAYKYVSPVGCTEQDTVALPHVNVVNRQKVGDLPLSQRAEHENGEQEKESEGYGGPSSGLG
jgi:selenocysteine lyase/cysteine desulfurase